MRHSNLAALNKSLTRGPLDGCTREGEASAMTDKLHKIIAPFVGETGGLISAMHAVQAEMGYLPEDVVPVAAELFNITKAEVKGVISFYADFRDQRAGANHVRVCVAESCQSMGSRELVAALEERFALKLGETDLARELTIEPVYCLGLCSVSPAAEVNGKLVAKADADKIAKRVEA